MKSKLLCNNYYTACCLVCYLEDERKRMMSPFSSPVFETFMNFLEEYLVLTACCLHVSILDTRQANL